MVNAVISEFRSWIAEMVGVTDTIPQASAEHPIRFTSVLKLEIPDRLVREFNSELGRVQRGLTANARRATVRPRRSGCCGCGTGVLIGMALIVALVVVASR